eukprot:TRINITY_DN15573_c0_g1_i1.p1 TRINITY_DN15573_c0_g1~~TRINITY_DN15573_c0_g1_i1.p1  ORF type:complete len:239 (+),score=38.40 TRINITY_DN15573_c0_g1_i1:171-887(+)
MGNCCVRIKRPSSYRKIDSLPKKSISPNSSSDDMIKNSKNAAQLTELASQTNFTITEIQALERTFRWVSESIENNGQITKEEFCLALFKTRRSNIFSDRVFEMFDLKRTGMIDFQEFVCAMNVFSHRTSLEQKARFAFNLYDIDQSGFIRPNEVKAFLMELFRNAAGTVSVPENVVDQIVENTFKIVDVDNSGTINMVEWIGLVHKKPAVINYMTLPKLMEITREAEEDEYDRVLGIS